jgi:hypothetical protein
MFGASRSPTTSVLPASDGLVREMSFGMPVYSEIECDHST